MIKSIKILILISVLNFAYAQNDLKFDTKPWSVRIADSFVLRHPGAVTYDSLHPNKKWNYEQGLILFALYNTWLHTGDSTYLFFVINNLDQYIDSTGKILTYNIEDYNIDNILPGRVLLELYEQTKREKYRKAAEILRNQLQNQPRTKEGGFWHKKIYPYQMWLDGLYMAEPFYVKYAVLFNEINAFQDIVNQFLYIANHTFDRTTGLYYHGWDEIRKQKWANPQTGCSPNFWSRSIGWYMMALVDVLDYLPENIYGRDKLVRIFSDLSASVLKYRDPESGVWYQVTDQIFREGNYLEASASCMFGYAFAKGASKGYLDKKFLKISEEIFESVLKQFVKIDDYGNVDLYGVCKSAGLGGNPYRDGSYEYYISEPTRLNDMKGYASFLLFAIELEKNQKRR